MYSIIGSGIAGLACSYVLSYFDIKNEIFESGDQKMANQYGIQLSPNASNVLQKMGVLKKLESHIKVINNIEKSFAGHFYSVLNVNPGKKAEVCAEINNVILSYKDYTNPNNQILIQAMSFLYQWLL